MRQATLAVLTVATITAIAAGVFWYSRRQAAEPQKARVGRVVAEPVPEAAEEEAAAAKFVEREAVPVGAPGSTTAAAESGASHPIQSQTEELAEEMAADEARRAEKEAAAEAAAEALKEAKKQKVARVEDLSRLGLKLYKGGQHEKAVERWSEAIQLARELRQAKTLKTLLNNRSAAYEKMGRPVDMLKDCSETLSLDRSNVKVLQRRARSHQLLHHDREALFDLATAYFLEVSRMQSAGGKPPSASLQDDMEALLQAVASADAAERVRTNPPRNMFMGVAGVRTYFRSFTSSPVDLPGPEVTLESLADAGADAPERLFLRALVHRQGGQLAEALADLQAAEQAGLATGPFFNELGTVLHLYGDLAAAGVALDKAAALLPDDPNTLCKRAGVAFDSGDRARADELFDAARPSADKFFHRGQMRLVADAAAGPAGALEDLRHALELDPAFALAHMQLGAALFRQGQMTDALAAFEAATALAADIPDVFAFWGEALMSIEPLTEENVRLAAEKVEMALQVDPRCPTALVNKASLIVKIEQTQEGITKSVGLLNMALDIDPTCQAAIIQLAQLKMQMGNLAGSLAEYDRALDVCKTETDLREVFQLKNGTLAQKKALEFQMGSDFAFDPDAEPVQEPGLAREQSIGLD